MAVRQWEGRSLFWPLVLIGVGLVWLLSNLGVLQPASVGVLFRMWPLLLIVVGLDILFGRRSPMLGTLLGIGAVALIIILMIIGPSLGWVRSADIKTASYDESAAGVGSVTVNLDLAVAEANIRALTDSRNLFEADLRYLGNLTYDVSGESVKTITLRETDQPDRGFNFWDWNFVSSDDLRWDIGLNPDVPVKLDVHSGVSSSTLDLQDLKLTGLQVDSGVGSLNLSLPAMPQPYDVVLHGGTGSMDIRVEEGAAVTFDINGGVGSVTVDVPEGAAVRVEASTGVGGISVPAGFQRISGDEDKFVGDEGVWESPGFATAERQIIIRYDGGVGGFEVK